MQDSDIRARKIKTRGFSFDALKAGSEGEPVLLLHGFPETSLMWSGLMMLLAKNGYYWLAPELCGYSPGACPTEVEAYRYEEPAADVLALGRELSDRFHVNGLDWSANVRWLMLATDPSPIASFTAISVPRCMVTRWLRTQRDGRLSQDAQKLDG